MELENLLRLTIEVIKVLNEQFKFGRLSYDEFNNHLDCKIHFVEDNIGNLKGKDKEDGYSVLKMYKDLSSELKACI